jgi:hypothetical protein
MYPSQVELHEPHRDVGGVGDYSSQRRAGQKFELFGSKNKLLAGQQIAVLSNFRSISGQKLWLEGSLQGK